MIPQRQYDQRGPNPQQNILPYSYEQSPYCMHQNENYYPVYNNNNQPLYIQQVNNSKGNFNGLDQFQNSPYQVYNQSQIPINYSYNYSAPQPPNQQYLPPKLKASMKSYGQIYRESSQAHLIHQNQQQQLIQQNQQHLIQSQQQQLYLNQRVQPQMVPGVNIQQQFTQNQKQRSFGPQKVSNNYGYNEQAYQYNEQQKQLSQQSQKKESYKPPNFLEDTQPPPAFDIMGHGNLPSVYFTFEPDL